MAWLYLLYPANVLVVIGAISGFGLAFVSGTTAYLLRRRVIVGPGWVAFLVSGLGLIAVGLVDIWLLQHPSFHGGEYGALFETAQKHGLFSLLSGGALMFVVYQMLGVAAFLIAFYLVVRAVAGLVARVNVQLSARPRWLWRALLRLEVQRTLGYLFGAALLATASVPLAAGTAYNTLMDKLDLATPDGLQITRVHLENNARRAHLTYRVNRGARIEVAVRRSDERKVRRRIEQSVERGAHRLDFWMRADHRALRAGSYRITVSARKDRWRDVQTVSFSVRR